MKTLTRRRSSPAAQHGISLIAVMVMLLLSLMAVMGAFRVSNLNEAMLGSTTDYNRTRTAAEALLRDAEIDILGRRPPYTAVQTDGTYGFPCRPNPPTSTTTLDSVAGFVGCRNQAAANTPWFPTNSEDFDAVTDIVTANAPVTNPRLRCKEGICVPLNTTDLANIENDLTNMVAYGATYGQFTRVNLTTPGVSSNPLLAPSDGIAHGWYWVELFRYTESINSGAAMSSAILPDKSKPFVYRITAVAQGLKDGTRVVLRTVFVPFPASQVK